MARVLTCLRIACLAAAVAACSDWLTRDTDMVFEPPADGDGGPPLTATFGAVQAQVIAPACALSGCHANGAYPDLRAHVAYANLVGAPSSAGYPLITAGDPQRSYLLLKLTGGPGMVGSRMPIGAAPLDSSRIALVRAWIERGAPND